MKHRYLFTLEITPLEAGKTYDELPSHLTLMSRFWSELSADALADVVQPLFEQTGSIELIFDDAVELGPKKLTVHLIEHSDELHKLHDSLRALLDTAKAEYEYPEYMGDNYKPHVTQREGVHFAKGDTHLSRTAYLTEIVDKKRVARAKFNFSK